MYNAPLTMVEKRETLACISGMLFAWRILKVEDYTQLGQENHSLYEWVMYLYINASGSDETT